MSIKSLIHSIQMMPVDTIGTLGELEQTYTNIVKIHVLTQDNKDKKIEGTQLAHELGLSEDYVQERLKWVKTSPAVFVTKGTGKKTHHLSWIIGHGIKKEK